MKCSWGRYITIKKKKIHMISWSLKNSLISCYHHPCFLESIVAEQWATCCCFYRQICHGDGCHPGHLPRASHPCSENGKPLWARHTSQTDVETRGGGPAAGAGLSTELLVKTLPRWWQNDLLLSHMSSWVCSFHDNWKTASQNWRADTPECQPPN